MSKPPDSKLRTLALFDIDGTLVWPDGAGRASLPAALHRVYGTQGGIDGVVLHGHTDRGIVAEALAAEGISQETIDAHFDTFCRALKEEMIARLPHHDIRACDGGLQLVERLRERGDVLLGLVTGNFHETAMLKLESAGYRPGDFRVGAYGSESANRADLPPLAVERAYELTGQRFEGPSIVVVGDTPADIACARSVNARTVAVATGRDSVGTLRQHAPDHALPNLVDTQQVLAAILGQEASPQR